jgi:hypothetical protein
VASEMFHKFNQLLQLLPKLYVTIIAARDYEVSSVDETERCGLFKQLQ